MNWKLKIGEDGGVVLKDGVPVWFDDDDAEKTESAFNPNQLHTKIVDLGRESKKWREEAQALKKRLEPVNDIEDLQSFLVDAEKAKETIKNLEEKDVRKAETVEKIKAEMRDGFSEKEQKLKSEFEQERAKLQTAIEARAEQIRKLMVSNQFATHSLFSGSNPKTTLPPDAAEALFGRHFRIEEGDNSEPKLVAYFADNNPVYSKDRVGELATFDEAITQIFDRYPFKDQVTRASSPGSGAGGGTVAPTGKGDNLHNLRKQLTDAMKAKDVLRVTALETAIFEAQQQQRQS